jgi:hypothetical protein
MLNLWLHRLVSAALMMLAASPPAQAHLMVAQRGTLNIVGDGKMSAAEFAAHRARRGQLAVALLCGILARGICRLLGDPGLATATRLASFSAMGMGGIWFVQRVLGLA